jgi:hypothetical protein
MTAGAPIYGQRLAWLLRFQGWVVGRIGGATVGVRIYAPLAAGIWAPRDGRARQCGTDAAEGEDGGEAFTGGKRRTDGLG